MDDTALLAHLLAQGALTPAQVHHLWENRAIWGSIQAAIRGQDLIEPARLQQLIGPDAQALDLQRRYRDVLARTPGLAPHIDLLERRQTLGKGGMGEVVLAFDPRLGRDAALKLIRQDLPPDRREHQARRFLREARITTRLEHPGIPAVYDFGITPAGQHFLLMQVVRGDTLRDLLQDPPDSAQRAQRLEILLKVADAVAFAHSQGVVHRDLKPDNVMVGRFGEVLVMDWGLAADPHDAEVSLDPDAPQLTQAGALLGTVGYLAPEQADGAPTTPRADVYSLGAILTRALTGQPACPGRTEVERLAATVAGTIRSPRQLRRDVPRPLDAIARKAMAFDPMERYPDAAAFAQDLRAALDDLPVSARREPPHERALRAVRRHPAAAVSLATLLVLGLVAVELFVQLRHTRNAAAATKKMADMEVAAAEAQSARDAAASLHARELAAEAQAVRDQIEAALDGIDHARQLARRDQPERAHAHLLASLEGTELPSLWTIAAEVLADVRAYDAAAEALERAIELAPPNYEALYALHLLEQRRRSDTANGWTHILERIRLVAHQRGDTNVYTQFVDAVELTRQGQDRRALQLYDRIEADGGRFAWLYINRGTLHVRLEQLDLALRDFDEAVRLDPDNPQAWANRAAVHELRGDPEASIEDCTRAIQLDPDYPQAFHNRASALLALGRHEAALRDLDQTLRLDPNDTQARGNRGIARFHLGRHTEALSDLDLVLAERPSDPIGRLFRARARIETDDLAGARDDLRVVLQVAGSSPLAAEARRLLRSLP